ncbi:MAG: glycosyltransferase [Bermanella sp.]
MDNNLHITLTDCQNETRLMKEAVSLSESKLFGISFVLSLHSDGLPLREKLGTIEINRVQLRSRGWGQSIVPQLLKYFEFLLKVLFFIKGRNISVITLHTLALLPVGWLCKKIYGISVVYDAHELETEKNGLNGIRQKLARLLEKIFIGRMDKTLVVSNRIRDWYEAAYPNCPKPVVIFNAPKTVELQNNDLFRKEFGIGQDKTICLYQGALEKGRGIELLVEAFKARGDDYILVLMGYGSLVNMLENLEDKSSIYYKAAVPPNDVLKYTMSADIGIALGQNICLSYYYSMPNKLFEFCMAGLPIISTPLVEIDYFLREYGAGYTIKSETVDALETVLADLNGKDLDALGRNARRAAEDNSWEVQELKLKDVYEKIVAADR